MGKTVHCTYLEDASGGNRMCIMFSDGLQILSSILKIRIQACVMMEACLAVGVWESGVR